LHALHLAFEDYLSNDRAMNLMDNDYYYTVEKAATAEYKDRGSKFIAFVFPAGNPADFKTKLKELKDEHSKAAHHCFAYRMGTEGIEFRSSDDGEPSGTAGKQILGQIDSRKLTNVAIIVVRYFGGTLLGVPGLINAYRTSATLALQTVPIVQKSIEINYRLEFDYTKINEVMMNVKKYHCTILNQTKELFCVMELGIPKKNLELVLLVLKEIKGIELEKID